MVVYRGINLYQHAICAVSCSILPFRDQFRGVYWLKKPACPFWKGPRMLISFTVGNFRSFAEPQTLSMVAAKDDAHPEHVVDCGTFGLLRTAALYGANASGKSNLVKAFRAARDFVTTSATKMNLGDTIPAAVPFRLDRALAKKPSSFEVRLVLSGAEYQYGFSVTKDRVCDEWLSLKRAGTKVSRPLVRHLDPETGKTDWTLRGDLRGAKDITEKTRDNGLFLSRAAEMNVDFVKELFLWFQSGVSQYDLAMPPVALTVAVAQRMGMTPDFAAASRGSFTMPISESKDCRSHRWLNAWSLTTLKIKKQTRILCVVFSHRLGKFCSTFPVRTPCRHTIGSPIVTNLCSSHWKRMNPMVRNVSLR